MRLGTATLIIPLIMRPFGKAIKRRNIVVMHRQQMTADRVELIGIGTNQFDHVTLIPRPARCQFQLH